MKPQVSPSVVDADAHVVEAGSFLVEILERFPDQVAIRKDGVPGVLVESRPYPDVEGPGAGCPADKGISDVEGIRPGSLEGVLADADAEGIDQMVLYPSFGMCIPSIEDPKLAEGMAQMYNDWIAGFCAASSGRLFGVGVAPIAHGDAALRALEQANDLGLVAAVIPPALSDRNLDHPDLDAFYDTAVQLDIAIGVHGAPGLHLPKIGVDRFTNYIQVHCVSFPFDQMAALTAMVTGGVFDRHPALRVAYLEAGAGWLPWFVERLGEHYEKRAHWIEGGWQKHPVEYVQAGNVTVTCEPEEAMLSAVIDELGPSCVMFASDYPHWDGAWPQATAQLREQEPRIGPDAFAAVSAGNARSFYKLPG